MISTQANISVSNEHTFTISALRRASLGFPDISLACLLNSSAPLKQSSQDEAQCIQPSFYQPLDCLLEPTPFREGTSLKTSSSSLKTTMGLFQVLPSAVFQDGSKQEKISPSPSKKRISSIDITEITAILDGAPINRPSKRAKTDDDSEGKEPRFRGYQEVQWQEQFRELLKFKKQYGHCHVHHSCKSNLALSKWVQRQRYQFKLFQLGNKSTMTKERQQKLEEIGFIWDAHAAAWEQRFQELVDYKKTHGNCNVPSGYPPSPQLAMWVKCQRRQFKLYWSGKTSNLTTSRLAALNKLGFSWELRSKQAV